MKKWRALFLLVLGCILVASPTYNFSSTDDCDAGGVASVAEKQEAVVADADKDAAAADASGSQQHRVDEAVTATDSSSGSQLGQELLGIGAVLIMVCLSGFSSVYFEGMLKNVTERVTIWERNFQLAFYSVMLVTCMRGYSYVTAYIESDYGAVAHSDMVLLKGWTWLTFLVACTMAMGGLLVAATLKYADSVMKTLATAGAIVLATLLGSLLLGDYLDIFVVIGCSCTILAIVNYTF